MSETLTVACKLPHGLHLDLEGKRITLNGTMKSGRLNKFFMAPDDCVGLTQVPVDFWEAWAEKNRELPQLKKGFIFANSKKKEVLSEAKEKSDLKTGLERIDPNKLPKGTKKIEPGEE